MTDTGIDSGSIVPNSRWGSIKKGEVDQILTSWIKDTLEETWKKELTTDMTLGEITLNWEQYIFSIDNSQSYYRFVSEVSNPQLFSSEWSCWFIIGMNECRRSMMWKPEEAANKMTLVKFYDKNIQEVNQEMWYKCIQQLQNEYIIPEPGARWEDEEPIEDEYEEDYED